MSTGERAPVADQAAEQAAVTGGHSFVVSVSHQLHGVTGCGKTTKHIYIDDGEDRARTLKYFAPGDADAGATKAPILFETRENEYHISSLFPGFSTMNLKGQLYFAKALLGGDGLNRTIGQYMIDREDYILRNPKSVLTYGIQTLFMPGQKCPNRFLSVDQDDPEMRVVYISICDKETNDLIDIFAIDVYRLFELVWDKDGDAAAFSELQGIPYREQRKRAIATGSPDPELAEQVIIPLDVLNETVKLFLKKCCDPDTERAFNDIEEVKLFHLIVDSHSYEAIQSEKYLFISYLDNCSPFFNDFDLKSTYADELRTAIVVGIQMNQIFVRELKKRYSDRGKTPLRRKQTSGPGDKFISLDKYDDGFLSGLQVLIEFSKIMSMLIGATTHPAVAAATVGVDDKWAGLKEFAQTIVTKKWHLKTKLEDIAKPDSLLFKKIIIDDEQKYLTHLVEHITAISNIKMATQELVFRTVINESNIEDSIKELSKKYKGEAILEAGAATLDPTAITELLNVRIVTTKYIAKALTTPDLDHGKRLQLKSRKPKKGTAISPKVVFNQPQSLELRSANQALRLIV